MAVNSNKKNENKNGRELRSHKKSKWGFSKRRYQKISDYDEDVDFSKESRNSSNFEYKSLPILFKEGSIEKRYKIFEERYDFACDILKKKCLNDGYAVPKIYKELDAKYLCMESTESIGETYSDLLNLFVHGRPVQGRQPTDELFKYLDPRTEKEEKKVKKFEKSRKLDTVIDTILRANHSWYCVEKSATWFVLKDPFSSKRVRIQIDIFGRFPLSIPVKNILVALKQLFKKWNAPFKADLFRHGTLTDCGWHSHLPKPDREEALHLAVSFWGAKHIKKALSNCKRLEWASNYKKQLEEDIQYVSKRFNIMPRKVRNYDHFIIVKRF